MYQNIGENSLKDTWELSVLFLQLLVSLSISKLKTVIEDV